MQKILFWTYTLIPYLDLTRIQTCIVLFWKVFQNKVDLFEEEVDFKKFESD